MYIQDGIELSACNKQNIN